MKLLITLFYSVLISTGFAQQSPAKKVVDPSRNVDNMPVLKDTGNTKEMPTRKGQGTAVDMPTYSGSATPETNIDILPRNFDGFKRTEDFQTDSTDRITPGDNKRQRKGKKQ